MNTTTARSTDLPVRDAATLAEMVDTLRALRILARAARRRAARATKAGQRAIARRCAAHARLLARAAIAVQHELRRGLALPVAA